ncbi:alpha/beta hydrolase family protein [Deinococcus yavapaiensis]|uniref:Alpha/beta hydrolase family protein n=1 Tax=Deinococcus yavapaiensis KR-236 TaxID=694435 RepID=A0A318SMT6_9DEIO|nr:alpha/beta hydrolase [Deinococcus yavapaiensis]PYE56202.1 hypothetical protein DES52_1016 [Deinococcus yavapaiensis KR-236]
MRFAAIAMTFLFGGALAAPNLPAPLAHEEVRVPNPFGDAYLLRPTSCPVTGCPLIIVANSRGLSAEKALERPNLQSIFSELTRARFAVLVSNDPTGRAWGRPDFLRYLGEIRTDASKLFEFNGHTYTLGYSMGGIAALMAAYKNVFPVSGVVLLDGRVNLLDAWQGSDAARVREIADAYGIRTNDPLPVADDPLHGYKGPREASLPILIAGSPDDKTVSLLHNGEALFARTTSRESRFVRLTGPHLGASHFGPEFTKPMLAFLERLEHLARASKREVGQP